MSFHLIQEKRIYLEMLQRQAEIDRQAQVFVSLELLFSMVCPQMVAVVVSVALVRLHNIADNVEAEVADIFAVVVSTLEK